MRSPLGRFLAVTLIAALALGAATRADIDCVVPPGLPAEWRESLPRPTLSDRGRVPGRAKGPAKDPQGSVEVATAPPPPPRFAARVDASFDFSGITTVDLPQHFPWSVPSERPDNTGPVITGGPRSKAPKYPPVASTHLHWLCVATLLRTVIHPGTTSTMLSIEHLILIGDGAYPAMADAKGQSMINDAARTVADAIGPPSAQRPAPSGGKTAFQEMVHRLALDELLATHPHDPVRPFAHRLMSLGHEAQGPLLHYSKSDHAMLRRNAVQALGQVGSQAAATRLIELLRDRDRVVRNRALAALVERGERASVPELLQLLNRKTDLASEALFVDALGRLGDPSARPIVLAWLRAHKGDPDALWVAIPALGRLGESERATLAELADLESDLTARPRMFGAWEPDHPMFRPPTPDVYSKAQIAAEMCRLARAGLGVERARTDLFAHLEKTKGTATNGATDRGRELAGIAVANRFFALDMLARMGERGHAFLLAVASDAFEHDAIRAHAVRRFQPGEALSFVEALDHLARLATAPNPGVVRAVALDRLAAEDPALGLATATQTARAYAAGIADPATISREWVVIPAMQIAGLAPVEAALDASTLLAIAKRADAERTAVLNAPPPAGPIPGQPTWQLDVPYVPPVTETALVEIGRAADPPTAEGALVERLRDPRAHGRPEAALALGAIATRAALDALIGCLADRDPWLRFCAGRALAQVGDASSDAPAGVDWLAASDEELAAAVARWREWRAKQPPEKGR